jgi:hypothetical protein
MIGRAEAPGATATGLPASLNPGPGQHSEGPVVLYQPYPNANNGPQHETRPSPSRELIPKHLHFGVPGSGGHANRAFSFYQ